MTATVVLQRHIDAAFDAYNLDQSGLLYVSDAVIALDALLTACWGAQNERPKTSTKQDANGVSANNNNNNNNTPNKSKSAAEQADQNLVNVPGVSRSKILQAIKSALLKAGVDPDAAVSEAPIVTFEIFQNAAQTLLAPLPNVQDVESFAAFQSLNQSAEKTRVNRRALRRALFAEYDADVYAVKDDEDELEERMRSGSAYAGGGDAGAMSSASSSGSNKKLHPVSALKFDAIRNMVGCDDLLLSRFAQYPSQGFSFDEWRLMLQSVVERQRKPRAPAPAPAPAPVVATPAPTSTTASTPDASSS